MKISGPTGNSETNHYFGVLKLWSADHRWSTGGFGMKYVAKIVWDTERMKNTPIQICAELPLLVELQQKVGKLVLSISSCPSFIILKNNLN
jgi:hypothetical protein